MTNEVIDLLSSSSFSDRAPSVSPVPRRPSPGAPPQSTTRSFDTDNVFDLTSDPPTSFQGPSRDAASHSTYSPASLPPKRVVPPTLFYEVDDFDTTGDFDTSRVCDEPLSHTARNGKRLRLSPPGDTFSKPSSRESSRSNLKDGDNPLVRQPGGSLGKARMVTDTIEFSSSPHVVPPALKSSKTSILDADDPFCSTSPLPDVGEGPSERQRSYLDDPFASTPPAPAPAPVSAGDPITGRKIYIDLEESEEDDVLAGSAKSSSSGTYKKDNATGTGPNGPCHSRPPSPKRLKKSLHWDPISSSAPETQTRDPFEISSPPRRSKGKGKALALIDLDDSDESTYNNRPRPSAESDDDLPDLDDIDVAKYRHRVPPTRPSRPFSRTNSAPVSRTKHRVDAASGSRTKKSADHRGLDKEARAAEREAKAAERERERERKKREKEAAKEQKAREKERAAAMAEVNKVRTDKKVSTPEMIVDMPSTLPEGLALQVKTLLKDLDVESTTVQSPVDNVVKWRRKVKSEFNDELGLWEPCELRIEPEKYALVTLTAGEFVAMALGSDAGADLDTHVAKVKRHFSDHQVLYLIEGLGPWMRKNRSLRNRQFVSAVRAQDGVVGGNGTPTQGRPSNEPAGRHDQSDAGTRRRRKNPPPRKEYVDEDAIEDALLQLQVLHGVLIHHTAAGVETAQWVAVFTQHISTVPYRKQREAANANGAGFCMETGQVRTGEDAQDTYAKLLQEIVRVTAPIAYGIAAEYGTVGRLVKGLEERGPLALEACPRSNNREGAPSDRTVGQAISRRIYKVFTGRDETSTDV
ncbi:hypothetical protein SODALDRAFT_346636 [Sodiomyces alkalinus F11]|uniref:ERCC4 domain-containing protein n=1 Tax=Sodiomyces alkalinus (strain CBS 110278 / VKM F-3762 / F11) TaxID=1314773 RepID=A0A3N2PKS0_SODAK|nr:hypothetical protein SODALDRAFT_346636 [Sodiomyces alkalinus F11]ROT35122.1 hypothetical protein SODALDRAFT_346636 [Sodiomyces alkalinus F11]